MALPRPPIGTDVEAGAEAAKMPPIPEPLRASADADHPAWAEGLDLDQNLLSPLSGAGGFVGDSASATAGKVLDERIQKLAESVIDTTARTMLEGTRERTKPYWTVYNLYRAMVAFGIAAFVLAAAKGLLATDATDAVVAGVFGGMSAATFATAFLTRPLRALERNALVISWLDVAVTTYWLRLLYMNDQATIQDDLSAAAAELTGSIEQLWRMQDAIPRAAGEHVPVTRRDDAVDQAR
jgi:hypothetical protein